jgi:molecular chaperone GrpE (heat shock protein)
LEVIEIINEPLPETPDLPLKAQGEVDHQPSLQSEMAAELKARFAEAAQAEEVAKELIVKMQALDLTVPLKALQKINNYLAFAIFDMTGEVIINNQLPTFELQIEQISANIAMIVKNIAKILRNTGLKKFDFMQMNFEAGICQASWVVENQFIAVVLLTPEAKNAGLARVHLDKVCDTVHSELFPSV